MLRKKLESESGTEIADSGFLIIYEKPADSDCQPWNKLRKFEKYPFLYKIISNYIISNLLCNT